MDKKKFLTLTTTGFALFAMFFGAGNLVIPPYRADHQYGQKGIKIPERKKPTKAAPLAAPIFNPI